LWDLGESVLLERVGEGWGEWRMEERRWVGEDAIEGKKDGWEVVGETGRGRSDRSERRCDKMMTLGVEWFTASS